MIIVGQDALGFWAWMLIGTDGELIESGQLIAESGIAIGSAKLAWADAKKRGEPACPTRPDVVLHLID